LGVPLDAKDHRNRQTRCNATLLEPNRGSFRDSVLPVVEAGLAQMVNGDEALDEHLALERAPGHTPGSVLVKLASAGKRALFCGDVLHHAIQIYHPDWNSFVCADVALARASRRKVLEHCSGVGALLMPGAFRRAIRRSYRGEGGRLRTALRLCVRRRSPGQRRAPGHTPGSVLVKLASAGKRALFCGDVLHHAIQVYYPDWNSFVCADAALARASRRKTRRGVASRRASSLREAEKSGPTQGRY
jgi:glyoxylase-like metal-dependent hydrolase (beta-lactamase superfamily II)